MSWLNIGRYKLWVINTKSDVPLYHWDTWKEIIPSVEVFLSFNSSDAYIRTFQSFEFENRWLGFGRMKWNEANNIKWTTKYRTPENQGKLRFDSTEIWAPEWNTVYNDNVSPGIYINLYHHDQVEAIRQGLVIAMPANSANRNQLKIDAELQRLLKIIPGAMLSVITRSWNPWWTYVNRIEDMNPHELHKIVYGTDKLIVANKPAVSNA